MDAIDIMFGEIETTGKQWKRKPSDKFLVQHGPEVSYNPITNEFGNFEDLTEPLNASI